MEKVFIGDDEPSLQFFYKQLLTLNGYKVACIANNGEAAISMFKLFSDRPKVILMDHRMSNKNRIEASNEILQMDNNK